MSLVDEWEHQRRVKRQYALLIIGAIAAIIVAFVAWLKLRHGQIGDECTSSDDCLNNGECLYDADGRNPRCTSTCSRDSDCPDGMTCSMANAMDDHGNTSFARSSVCAPR